MKQIVIFVANMKFILIGILTIASYCLADKVRYDDYTVYSLSPKNAEAIEKLKDWRLLKNCDLWTPITSTKRPVDIMVPPAINDNFLNVVESLNIEYKVKIRNVQELVDRTEVKKSSTNLTFSWDAYYTLEEIHTWLNSLATQYPDTVTVFSAGQSYEKRDLLIAKVSFSSNNANRSIFIEGNIHAREWITNAVSTYVLNEVLTSQDADFRTVVEAFDWYILPVTNPDGYEYSHTTNRLWRKTMVPYGNCLGADPNRNWDFYWDEGSDYPCAEDYIGSKPFSEPSIAALSQYLTGIANDLVSYITFHSYSQLLMVPYGNTTEHLDNYNVTYALGLKAAEALARRYGTEYEVGNIAETVYWATGISLDWVKDNFHVPYGYSYELRDTGNYGFLLPPEQIIPTSEETLDSVVAILNGILENEGIVNRKN